MSAAAAHIQSNECSFRGCTKGDTVQTEVCCATGCSVMFHKPCFIMNQSELFCLISAKSWFDCNADEAYCPLHAELCQNYHDASETKDHSGKVAADIEPWSPLECIETTDDDEVDDVELARTKGKAAAKLQRQMNGKQASIARCALIKLAKADGDCA